MAITTLYNCTEVRDFLVDYQERRLARREHWLFRIHLWLCPQCRRYIAKYNSSVELWRGVEREPPPAELVDLTLEFVRKRAQAKPGSGANDTAGGAGAKPTKSS